jgi:tetratricopeptide (TPR) repeat protein
MARKKRRFEQLQAAAATPQEKKIYTNPLQQQVGSRLEDVGRSFEGKGRTILYGAAALVVLIALLLVFMNWSKRSNAAAQTALGKAIETSQAQISETGTPAGSTQKTYKTERERAEAAIAEFQGVADKFGGDVADKAKYFIAVNRLVLDRPAGIAELEALAGSGSEVGSLAKFALAQTRNEAGRADEAVVLYQELLNSSDSVIAKDTINFEIAKIYEKQGKKQEAADIYFNIAKAASEAKDLDGKPVRMTETATESKAKLTQIDPERAKQIVEPAPESPFGGVPIGM